MNNEQKGKEEHATYEDLSQFRGVPKEHDRWLSRFSGTVGGMVLVSFSILIPVVNTWLENTKEVQILQIKNTAEQVAYITKRMEDADRERDLYKKEMLLCQQELREARGKR